MSLTVLRDHGAIVAATHGLTRSDKWPLVEHKFKFAHPVCAACPSGAVQVHHVMPFHFCILLGRPDLELDPRNLISLCETQKGELAMDHHLLLGHLDDFQSYNPDVRAAVIQFAKCLPDAIRHATPWLAACVSRPPVWAKMTDEEKRAFRALMDSLYPVAT